MVGTELDLDWAGIEYLLHCGLGAIVQMLS